MGGPFCDAEEDEVCDVAEIGEDGSTSVVGPYCHLLASSVPVFDIGEFTSDDFGAVSFEKTFINFHQIDFNLEFDSNYH